MSDKIDVTADDYEAMIKENDNSRYVLKLFVTGMTPKSKRSIKKIKEICEIYLKDRYELEIVDLYQNPEKAREAQVIAAPTLIKKLPLPLRKIIGDLTNEEKVIVGLNLKK